MFRRFLPLALLAILGLGLTLFLWPLHRTSALPKDAGKIKTVLPETAAFLAATTATAALTEPPTSSLERTAIALPDQGPAVVYGEAVEEGVLVTVVDADSKEALPNAEVMVLDTDIANMRLFESEMAVSPDFEHVFAALGIVYSTDRHAQVRIPQPVGQLFLAGRTATYFDFTFDIDALAKEVTLELSPVDLFPVKVLNASGHPVQGAPIALRLHQHKKVQDLMQTTTDVDGMAYLRFFDLMQRELADDPTFIALRILAPTAVEVPIAVNEIPTEALLLTLPECGELEVLLLDSEGNPEDSSFLVRLDLVPAKDLNNPKIQAAAWQNSMAHLRQQSSTAKALFPLVAFDQTLKISALSRDGERYASQIVSGPTRGYPQTTIRLSPQIQRPILVGRIVDAEGQGEANLNLNGKIVQSGLKHNSTQKQNLRTDATGKFRLPLEKVFRPGGVRTLTLTQPASSENPLRMLQVDLSRRFESNEQNLGDLILEIPPLLAQGQVVDTLGFPIPGASVRLEREISSGKATEKPRWEVLWDLQQHADAEGLFSIRGFEQGDRFRLRAEHENYLAQSIYIHSGATHLELRLSQAHTLKGQFLLDSKVDASLLQVGVRRPDVARQGKLNTWFHDLDANGNFVFKKQPQGNFSLTLKSKRFDQEFSNLDNFVIQAEDKITTLDPIPLYGRIQTITLSVVNLQGKFLQSVTLSRPGSWWSHTYETQPIHLLSRAPGLNLQIKAKGYRDFAEQGLLGTREIVLSQGIPIQVVVENIGRLPSGWTLSGICSRIPTDGESPQEKHSKAIESFGSDSEETNLSLPGLYRLQFSLKNEERPSGIFILPGEAPTFSVLEQSFRQIFTVTLSQKALDFAQQKAEQEP